MANLMTGFKAELKSRISDALDAFDNLADEDLDTMGRPALAAIYNWTGTNDWEDQTPSAYRNQMDAWLNDLSTLLGDICMYDASHVAAP